MQDIPGLVDHLFRRESGKMVSYLTRLFGLGRLNLAEDIVQDVLLQALRVWPAHGLPDNPTAWLMRAARNRAIDQLRRDDQFRDIASELGNAQGLHDDSGQFAAFDCEIPDDQLRLMFSCCHPELSTEVQVTLILKTLCGFSVSEIASALLASEDSIEKRLSRARNLFRESGTLVELNNASEIPQRLEAVYQAIYLLFNEGYHGSQAATTVREDLCYEALRLVLMLTEHPQGAWPKSYALVALFCFNAARLPGRIDAEGDLVPLEEQDRSGWDRDLIGKGFEYLGKSAAEFELSEFHLQAAIAGLHSGAESFAQTDWRQIQGLYDLLYQIKPTPMVALNRAIAIGQVAGPDQGLRELENIPDAGKLASYPFYAAAQGELHRQAGRFDQAQVYLEAALRLARNPAETQFLERKLRSCHPPSSQ